LPEWTLDRKCISDNFNPNLNPNPNSNPNLNPNPTLTLKHKKRFRENEMSSFLDKCPDTALNFNKS